MRLTPAMEARKLVVYEIYYSPTMAAGMVIVYETYL
jgi:hypothetical protein